MKNFATRKPADLILLISVILFACVLLFVFYLLGFIGGNDGAFLRVTADGVLYGVYPLDTDISEITIYTSGGAGMNVLEIKDRQARVIKADCPDGLCVRQGAVGHTHQTIVCIPNRLVITIENAGTKNADGVFDLDGVSR